MSARSERGDIYYLVRVTSSGAAAVYQSPGDSVVVGTARDPRDVRKSQPRPPATQRMSLCAPYTQGQDETASVVRKCGR